MADLAQELDLPVSQLFSAASFYSYFDPSLNGRSHCEGPVCRLRGGAGTEDGHSHGIACPGLCDQAQATARSGEYRGSDGPAEYLRPPGLPSDSESAIFGTYRAAGTEGFESYRASGGYQAFLDLTGEEQIERSLGELEVSGLRGRGGAAFPLAAKWRAVRQQPQQPKYIVCNADEGEPGTFKDRAILHLRPHLLLEGMAIAGRIVGAKQGIIYLRHEYPLAYEVLNEAVQEAIESGILAPTASEDGPGFAVYVRRGAGSYVCGEETALLNSLEGRRPWPRERPPFPTTNGLWGQPTVLNNVETLATVPAILRNGGSWFEALGVGESAGTKLYSLSGDVERPGNFELPLGTTARELIFEYGDGPPGGRRVKAFTLGGISGGLLGEDDLDTPLDYRAPKALGCFLGSGGVIVLDGSSCAVDFVRSCLAFYEDESCGKCAPCRLGTVQLHRYASQLANLGGAGGIRPAELDQLIKAMHIASACGLGQSAPLVLEGLLTRFAGEVEAHRQGHCPAGTCGPVQRDHAVASK